VQAQAHAWPGSKVSPNCWCAAVCAGTLHVQSATAKLSTGAALRLYTGMLSCSQPGPPRLSTFLSALLLLEHTAISQRNTHICVQSYVIYIQLICSQQTTQSCVCNMRLHCGSDALGHYSCRYCGILLLLHRCTTISAVLIPCVAGGLYQALGCCS
jgi:hypothetical protein